MKHVVTSLFASIIRLINSLHQKKMEKAPYLESINPLRRHNKKTIPGGAVKSRFQPELSLLFNAKGNSN
jgi:hypothetical protein